ncbi:nucleotidyl transferase AbiEii/AbiGii toxin family protein [Patescibacteria group bacterium]|nr:nucleotidyl transferase AbiEii/AbiGii toxin family protein [Patescibacteria group bacterium]
MDITNKQVNLNFTHIPEATNKAIAILSKQLWLRKQKWYLAGGTALTLQYNHRTSVDLDFFNPRKDIDSDLNSILSALHPDWITTNQKQDTLYGELENTKISFIAYPYFIPKQPFINYGSMNILDARDIAVMKIIAISQRGKKRDFFDLYWYINNKESLMQVLKRVKDQFPNAKHNYHHIIKSLTFFEDAEEDPEPQIFFDADWKKIKEYFLSIIPKVANELL